MIAIIVIRIVMIVCTSTQLRVSIDISPWPSYDGGNKRIICPSLELMGHISTWTYTADGTRHVILLDVFLCFSPCPLISLFCCCLPSCDLTIAMVFGANSKANSSNLELGHILYDKSPEGTWCENAGPTQHILIQWDLKGDLGCNQPYDVLLYLIVF